ncbi:Fc.00g082240.m01.CDS01 [Cosmosporella sp. VM-42]
MVRASYAELTKLNDVQPLFAASMLLPASHVDASLQSKCDEIHRQSILMRLSGNITGSEQLIQTFISNLGKDALPPDSLASLHLSQAVNLMYHFRFQEAHHEIKKWKPARSLRGRHEQLLWDQMLCVGRALKGEGQFKAASTVLETCLATPGLCRSKRCRVVSALADVFCELSHIEQDPSYLLKAEMLVEPVIGTFGPFPIRSPHPRGLRRLLLSLLEIRIKQGRDQDAKSLVDELFDTYGKLEELDIVDRLGHVRALIADARLSPGPDHAVARWANVLAWNKFYNPSEEEVFTCGVAYLALSASWHRLGNWDISTSCLQKADYVLARKQAQFLIPGLGTYVFRNVSDSMQVFTG